jgi:iron complex transport system substrate-binding protein
MRICSLLPSATEIVFALGLGDRLVAITHECDYPEAARGLPVITRSIMPDGGGASRDIHTHVARARHAGSSIYALDQAALERLAPDLIVTQELCDVCAVSYRDVQAAARRLTGPRTILSLEPTSLDGILETIEEVGATAGVPERAAALVAGLRARVEAVAARRPAARPRVFAMEWLDPPFTAGHWVPEMVGLAGGDPGLGRAGHPAAVVAWDDVAAWDPEIVVLMPCGLSLDRTLAELARVSLPPQWRRLAAVRAGQVYAVDGSAYFNRPGPRIADGLEILAEIIHPELHPRAERGGWERVAFA